MYNLIIKLMVTAALVQLGISLADFKNCHSRTCLKQVEQRSRDILEIDWRPISIFPEEAKKFR